jgi:hypothetical protein
MNWIDSGVLVVAQIHDFIVSLLLTKESNLGLISEYIQKLEGMISKLPSKS